ncbi:MFS transporter [Candidatus Dojkabacteria bacterium]|nr:MFS transporter [Candidatus Dojkabacteria bacterium]
MSTLGKVKKAVLSSRNFLLLWLAQLFTQSAVSIITILMGILSDEGTLSSGTKDSATSIGIIVNLSTLPGLVISPIAGVLADWFNKKKIMLFSNLCRLILLILFILVRGWENLILSYSLVFILSIILQFFIPAEGGLIPRVAGKKYLLLASSLFSLTVYTTLAVGLALAGLVLNVFGVGSTFVICGLLFVISDFLLMQVRVPRNGSESKSFKYLFDFLKELITDVKSGISYAFKIKPLRFALVHLLLLQIVALTLVTIVFRIGSEIYGVSPRSAGIVVFAPIVIGLLVGIASLNIFGKERNRTHLIWVGTIFSIIGFGFMAMISAMNGMLEKVFLDEAVATISLIAVGLSVPFLLIPAQTMIHENTKSSFRGRVLGIWLALNSSFSSIIAVFMGIITDKVGDIFITIMTILILAILYSGTIFYLYIVKKKTL